MYQVNKLKIAGVISCVTVLFGMQGCSSTVAEVETQTNLDTEGDMTMDLVSIEYLLANSTLEEEDFKGISIEDFIKRYELTEEAVADVYMEPLLERYRQELQRELNEYPDYSYLRTSDNQMNKLNEEDIENIHVVAFYYTSGTYQESLLFDFQNKVGYLGETIDLLESEITEYTDQVELSDDEIQEVGNILQQTGVPDWNLSYEGQNEETTGSFGWNLYIELNDGSIIQYAGKGVIGASRPENYDEFVEKLKEVIKE